MLKPDNLPVTFGKNDVELLHEKHFIAAFFH